MLRLCVDLLRLCVDLLRLCAPLLRLCAPLLRLCGGFLVITVSHPTFGCVGVGVVVEVGGGL